MILLVDDDLALRELMVEIVARPGRVLEADNGQEALDILRAGAQVRLIFSDISMPVMCGRKFALQRRVEFAHVPLVLLSGEKNLHEIHEEYGTTGFIRKPMNLEAVEATILKYAP